MDPHIRNFAIIAHIDHGKSTLADRLIQLCGGLSQREMRAQVLDSMELERERGITIKSQAVRLHYEHAGQRFELNMVDTPGHVDFTYEVSRSLAACEGALLVVDASQGVEAQTLANVYAALSHNLTILPVLNKIDLPAADAQRVQQEIEEIIGIDASDAIPVSAKTGEGVNSLLAALIERVPAPVGAVRSQLCCLLVDSWYDPYYGVMLLVRVVQGQLKRGDRIVMLQTRSTYTVERLGHFTPKMVTQDTLVAGQVGFVTAGIKRIADCKVGDTLTLAENPVPEALAGFRHVPPVVFCGIFPSLGTDFDRLRTAIEKLALNDASFTFERESSTAFGLGFRCGFLGLLHMEIIQERLQREYDLELILTAPSVVYELLLKGKQTVQQVTNPREIPDANMIAEIREPWIKATILVGSDHVGAVLNLCTLRRGNQVSLTYAGDRLILVYELPLNEVVFDFHDRLKSLTSGYASFDYEPLEVRAGDLVKLDILINGDLVEAFSAIVPRQRAESRGRGICTRLRELIPRQNYRIAIQAAIGGKILARETVSAFRKDVTAKCYGGDVTRKRKLLEKQKAGKKRMQRMGKVEIPQQAFIKALQHSDDA